MEGPMEGPHIDGKISQRNKKLRKLVSGFSKKIGNFESVPTLFLLIHMSSYFYAF
jgi:hypothetical protein